MVLASVLARGARLHRRPAGVVLDLCQGNKTVQNSLRPMKINLLWLCEHSPAVMQQWKLEPDAVTTPICLQFESFQRRSFAGSTQPVIKKAHVMRLADRGTCLVSTKTNQSGQLAHHAVDIILIRNAAAEGDTPLSFGRRQRLQLLANAVASALGDPELLGALRTGR